MDVFPKLLSFLHVGLVVLLTALIANCRCIIKIVSQWSSMFISVYLKALYFFGTRGLVGFPARLVGGVVEGGPVVMIDLVGEATTWHVCSCRLS